MQALEEGAAALAIPNGVAGGFRRVRYENVIYYEGVRRPYR